MKVMLTTGQTLTAGCYIGGHHGHYVLPGIIRLAQDYGFTPNPTLRDVVDTYDERWHTLTADEQDALYDGSYEAIDFLNSITRDGLWEEYDGELFLTARCPHCANYHDTDGCIV